MKAAIKSTILLVLRSPKYLIFSMFFPIFLTILLGGILGKDFEDNNPMNGKVIYYVNNIGKDGESLLKTFHKVSGKGDINLSLKQISSVEEGKNEVRKKDEIFLEINKDKINIFVQNGRDFYYSYIKSLLTGIIKRGETANLLIETNKIEGANILRKGEVKDGGISINIIKKEEAPTSFDYYAIAELTLMLLYLMLFPMSRYFEDKRIEVKERMKLLGISDFKYYFGGTIGYFILSFIITLPSFLFSNYILKTNWGSYPLLCYGGIQIFALASISIGTVIASLCNSEEKVLGVLQAAVFPILSFLGGSYIAFPDDVGGLFQIVTNISPIRWLNRGIMQSIFKGENSLLMKAYFGGAIIILLMAGIMIISGKRKDCRI